MKAFRLSHLTILIAKVQPVLLCVLLWLLAGLFWRVFEPSPQALRLILPLEISAQRAQDFSVAQDWFGSDTSQATTVSTLQAKLLAVIAGQKGYGAAIFTGLEASAVAAQVGQTLQGNIKLIEIAADHVVLDDNGRRQTLMLEGHNSVPVLASGALLPATPSNNAPAAAAAQATLSRGQLAGAMQGANVADWAKGLSTYREGGIQIDNIATQPFSRLLQLQNGDVIKTINGQNLAQVADISLIYTVFSQQPQVLLVVLRNGSSVNLQYLIQP
ncbi:type II secretion system protein N [Iodobacter sp. CM08]|uniref:type II secretion system protein N n=1 Tax=Iodobacter sp. CM08 TaxID=3085902 RepID=UPI00298176F6|nr:type II secretion system protein N [Iodobacter sp. CM08]MDW5416572.1 type II secretion system protein N [Iodobacter sp. CM08]